MHVCLTKGVLFKFHHVTNKQRAEETNVKHKPSSDFALVRLINFCSAIIVLIKFS